MTGASELQRHKPAPSHLSTPWDIFAPFLSQIRDPDSSLFRQLPPALTSQRAGSATGRLRALPHRLLAERREGRVAGAGLRQAACRSQQAGQSKALQRPFGEGVQWKQKPFHSAHYQRVQMSLGNPWPAWPVPSAGLWTAFLRGRMMQSKWNKRAALCQANCISCSVTVINVAFNKATVVVSQGKRLV